MISKVSALLYYSELGSSLNIYFGVELCGNLLTYEFSKSVCSMENQLWYLFENIFVRFVHSVLIL